MALKANGFWSAAMWFAAFAGLSAAQAPTPAPAQPPPGQSQTPTFRVRIDAVTMDVVVKDERGRFVSDLTKDEFEIYEDGVKQDIASLTVVSGGRVTNVLEAAPDAPPEGVILPPKRKPVDDTSGRIFIFFVDDLNLQFETTARVRDIFKKISKELVHEGDLFGIVSSGPSSIEQDLTYDKKRLDVAILKMTGDGMRPADIINVGFGRGRPTQLKYRAHVSFSTMLEQLGNLDKVHNRRKELVWVSEGYDFYPFQNSRLGLANPNSPFTQNPLNQTYNTLQNLQSTLAPGPTSAAAPGVSTDPAVNQALQTEEWGDAELSNDLLEVTRAANRANVTIYTIDPRGLVAGGDIEDQIDPREWNKYIQKTQDSLRVLAEDTGGLAVVNQNDFDTALKRIDADSSDYYVLGYSSSNPDPTKRRRQLAVKVTRPKLTVTAQRTEYVLKPPPKPASPKNPPLRPASSKKP